MKILFCGSNVPNEIEYKVKNISAAGNRFQNNFIHTMQSIGHEIINLSFIGVPIGADDKKVLEEATSQNTNYFSVIKEQSKRRATKQYIALLSQKLDYVDIVICYNIVYAWFELNKLTRRKGKKTILILADYSDIKSFHSSVRKMYASLQLHFIRKYDIVVGLSANVKRHISKKQKFVLMEGGIEESFFQYFALPEKKSLEEASQQDGIVFLYSGLLSQVTGVDLLLEAFEKVQSQKAQLNITGKGDLEKLVQDASKKDKRIRFLGHLEYSKYMEELKKADVLVNPRNMDLPENQNNFPSKILDYLATGNTVLSTKFVGWEKFKENIVFTENDMDFIGQEMERLCIEHPNYYNKNREKAEQYLWKRQINRILQ